MRGVIGNSAKSVSDTENVAYRNPLVDASLWKEVNIIDNPSSGGRYNLGKPNDDGYRVLFNSYEQNRDGTTGENAYIIKEIAVVNTTQRTSSQSKASASYTIAEDENGQNGNNITTKSGGDDIYLRIYYDESE